MAGPTKKKKDFWTKVGEASKTYIAAREKVASAVRPKKKATPAPTYKLRKRVTKGPKKRVRKAR